MEEVRISKSAAALDLLDRILAGLLDGSQCPNLPVLVAFDIEVSGRKLAELGFSVFDPYCLRLLHGDIGLLNDRISTYHYATAGSRRRKRYKPYRLGTVQRIENDNVQQIIDAHLTPRDDDGNLRKMVLIGHNIIADLRFLERHLGFELSRMPSVEAILDTQNISRPILMSAKRLSLKRVLQDFELSYVGLHNAGHDSRYTMRALLMLLAKHKRSDASQRSEEMMNIIVLMEDIARCHKTNPRRTWTPCKKIKVEPMNAPNMFDQDVDEDEDCGMLGLLDSL